MNRILDKFIVLQRSKTVNLKDIMDGLLGQTETSTRKKPLGIMNTMTPTFHGALIPCFDMLMLTDLSIIKQEDLQPEYAMNFLHVSR